MKKKFMVLIAFAIFSIGAYCDIYFMLGADLGYANMAEHGGFIFETFFDTQYYPFDGPIGVGLDLKFRLPAIDHVCEYDKNFKETLFQHGSPAPRGRMDFVVAPTLSLRLVQLDFGDLFFSGEASLYPVLKVFPVFAYSKHREPYFIIHTGQSPGDWPMISELYIGGGAEICFSMTGYGEYPKGGGEIFLTYSYGRLMQTNEKYFSIGLGGRGFFRRSLRDKRAVEKAELKLAQLQAEYAARQEQKRQQEELERQEAEAAAIKSSSLDEMINFINQYGDSKNIRLAVEQVLSGNKNQPYKEFNGYENPYGFEKGSVYYCSSLNVHQWLSEYSFLAKVNGDVIYVETANIENLKNRISYAFLKANGVLEYNTAASSLKIVPRFTLMLFSK